MRAPCIGDDRHLQVRQTAAQCDFKSRWKSERGAVRTGKARRRPAQNNDLQGLFTGRGGDVLTVHNAFVASLAPVTHWKIKGDSMDFTELPKATQCTNEYPCLNEWLYTLDAVVPVIDLQQTPYWTFDKSSPLGSRYQLLFSLLTVFGWMKKSRGWPGQARP